MSLDDLKERIYDPGEKLPEHQHEASPFDPQVGLKADSNEFRQEKGLGKAEKGLTPDQKKVIKVASFVLAGVILIIGATVAVYRYRQSAFREEQVSITIEGSDSTSSNEDVSYRVVFKNGNRAALRNAKLYFNYSKNFVPENADRLQIDNINNSHIEIGEIAPFSQGEFDLVGKFFAPKNALVFINASLEYSPSNFSSRFRKESRIGVNIKNSPLKIDIEAPLEVITGKQIDYVIRYENLSPGVFRNVRIKAEYPREFNFISAIDPPNLGDNTWVLGDVEGGRSGKIVIHGDISGARNDSKLIKVSVEAENENGELVVFGEEEKATKIIASPLFISQKVNEKDAKTVNAGDSLYYTITFGNMGEIGLRSAIIKMKINSRIIDFVNLRGSGGFFDAATQTITWKAPEIKELVNLEPGSKRQIRIPMKVLQKIPVQSASDKNFTVDTLVEIDSPDIATPIKENKIISSNRLVLKLNSPVILEANGYYTDANIPNSGPVPPTVGQETSYTLHWKVANVANDLDGVEVRSALPSGVKWTGKVYPEGEQGNISFNERTNQIVWKIGKMENGVGVLNAPREAAFQVSIVPQINQTNAKVRLLEESVLTGNDLFTGEILNVDVKAKGTDLFEDKSLEGKYNVISQ